MYASTNKMGWDVNEAYVEVRARMEEISILPPPEPSDFAPINHSRTAS